MRRLLVRVPEGRGAKVEELASRHGSAGTVSFSEEDGYGPVDLVLLHVPNRRVGDLVEELSAVNGLHVSMFPHGVLNLQPLPGGSRARHARPLEADPTFESGQNRPYSRVGGTPHCRGSRSRNTAPRFTAPSACRSPLWARASSRAMARPSPVPPPTPRVRAVSIL